MARPIEAQNIEQCLHHRFSNIQLVLGLHICWQSCGQSASNIFQYIHIYSGFESGSLCTHTNNTHKHTNPVLLHAQSCATYLLLLLVRIWCKWCSCTGAIFFGPQINLNHSKINLIPSGEKQTDRKLETRNHRANACKRPSMKHNKQVARKLMVVSFSWEREREREREREWVSEWVSEWERGGQTWKGRGERKTIAVKEHWPIY